MTGRRSRALAGLGAALVAASLLVAMIAREEAPPASGRRTLTVFAAASLRDAFSALESPYEASRADVDVVFSFDASSHLRAQIEAGAPADVFASADEENPQRLVDAGLSRGPASAFASNALALVVPTDLAATGPVRSAVDLADDSVRIVAAGEDVPITKYADAMIAALVGRTGFGDDFPGRVRANVVSREDNVRAVLAKIETGEGDAAIVYRTDALASDAVTELPIPGAAAASYAAVAIQAGPNGTGGSTFVAWLVDAEAQGILARFGFLPPGE